MALDSKQGNCSNTPELLKAMVNEFIVGAIVDYDGNKWLVVKSGYAIVFGRHGAYWRESPTAVKALIDKRRADLGKWSADLADLARLTHAPRHLQARRNRRRVPPPTASRVRRQVLRTMR